MMDEDLVVAKLQGYNCLIKFKDGEELLINVAEVDGHGSVEWFEDAENFINGKLVGDDLYFPLANIAIARDSIKYIRKL